VQIINVPDKTGSHSDPGKGLDHIPGRPDVRTFNSAFTERVGATHSSAIDTVSNKISFVDINAGDHPTASAKFSSFTYQDANNHDVTATLTPEQLAAIAAVEVPLSVVQATGNTHDGSARWTYSIADKAFDFIADNETLILNYVVKVDDGHGGLVSSPITVSLNGADVSVTGTNDIPTIATTSNAFVELSNPVQPNPTGSTTLDTVSDTISFTYDQGNTPPSTDKVTLADGHGATDTVNFIFNVAGNPAMPVTLTGTTGKDVFFGTGDHDKFVFAAQSNHDTIMDFTPGQDKIDLSAVVTTNNASTWMSQHAAADPTHPSDTLITRRTY
jgi:Peptidase M10 serralysin C terminal